MAQDWVRLDKIKISMSTVNETLIRDVVAEVLGRLNGSPAPTKSAPAPASTSPSEKSCGCGTKKTPTANVALRGRFGVFQDANEACGAAQEAYLQLKQKGV